MRFTAEVGATLAMSVALAGCTQEKSPVDKHPIPPVIKQAQKDYIGKYGCMNDVRVVFGHPQEAAALGGNTVAISEPGLITVDATDWAQMSESERRDTILHEESHACKNKEVKSVTPFELADGSMATGIHGLSLMVETPSGQHTGFRLIEEGAAEALAYSLDNTYTTSSSAYHTLGSLTLNLMTQHNISPDDLSSYLQTNNLYGFVGALHGSNIATNREVEETMRLYQGS